MFRLDGEAVKVSLEERGHRDGAARSAGGVGVSPEQGNVPGTHKGDQIGHLVDEYTTKSEVG